MNSPEKMKNRPPCQFLSSRGSVFCDRGDLLMQLKEEKAIPLPSVLRLSLKLDAAPPALHQHPAKSNDAPQYAGYNQDQQARGIIFQRHTHRLQYRKDR